MKCHSPKIIALFFLCGFANLGHPSLFRISGFGFRILSFNNYGSPRLADQNHHPFLAHPEFLGKDGELADFRPVDEGDFQRRPGSLPPGSGGGEAAGERSPAQAMGRGPDP
jgi:hypothetical protein